MKSLVCGLLRLWQNLFTGIKSKPDSKQRLLPVKQYLLKVLLLLYFTSAVGLALAQERPGDAMVERSLQTIGLKDVEQLYKITSRDDIATSVKMRAVRRIAEIYRQNPQEGESKASEMVQALEDILKKANNDQTPVNHFMLRAEACLALGSYDESKQSSRAYNIVDNQLKNDRHIEVRTACAQSLGFFKKSAAEAGQKLLVALEAQLKAEPIQEYDIRLTINIINSLGRLKYRDAFVTLIKVLQSGYPPAVKKEAERAIKEITS